MTELDVLSLYDGCSMARVALERAGIPIKEYYASEIDKYAITIAKKNFPNAEGGAIFLNFGTSGDPKSSTGGMRPSLK